MRVPSYLPSATIARVIPALALENRDAPLDPHSGYALDLRLEVAHPSLGAPWMHAAAFWRALINAQTFYTLATPHIGRISPEQPLGGPLVVAAALQYAAAGPWTARGQVPSSETFAYGGDFSVRGLVTRASSAVLLAHYMVIGSIELRWYLLELGIGTLQLAAFTDMGTVAASPRGLFHQTALTAGPVLRYVTPIGPLSLAYGLPVRRPSSFRAFPKIMPQRGRLHLTFGYSF